MAIKQKKSLEDMNFPNGEKVAHINVAMWNLAYPYQDAGHPHGFVTMSSKLKAIQITIKGFMYLQKTDKELSLEAKLNGLTYIIRAYGVDSTYSVLFFDIISERFMGCLTMKAGTPIGEIMSSVEDAYMQIYKQRLANVNEDVDDNIVFDMFNMMLDDEFNEEKTSFYDLRKKLFERYEKTHTQKAILAAMYNAVDRFIIHIVCEEYFFQQPWCEPDSYHGMVVHSLDNITEVMDGYLKPNYPRSPNE